MNRKERRPCTDRLSAVAAQPQSRARKRFANSLRAMGAALLAATVLAPAVQAESAAEFPNRTVRIVLPLPPGSVNDTGLRILAEKLAERWKQPVVIENRPGASSIIATEAVVRAQPDGHTLLANVALIVQNPVLRKKLPYDTFKDLTPVTQLNRQQLSVFVRSDLPVQNIADLITLAREKPGSINFGSWGLGSTAHLLLETLNNDFDVKMVHVPYKGGLSLPVASGEVDVGVGDILAPMPMFKSGQIRPIVVSGAERLSVLPEVETLKEAGVNGFDVQNWLGLFAPSGTPPEIIRKISDDINAVQAEPALKKRFEEEMYVFPTFTTPEEFAALVQESSKSWTEVIQKAGVTLDP